MRLNALLATLAIVALFVVIILIDGDVDTAISHNNVFQTLAFWGAIFGVVMGVGAVLITYVNNRAARSANLAANGLPDYSALLHQLNDARKAGDARAYRTLANSDVARRLLADAMLAGDRAAFQRFITSGQAALSTKDITQGNISNADLDHAFFSLTIALQCREIALRDGASVREISRMKAVE